jgi:hypothetical protein
MGTLALDFRARPWPERCIEQRIPDGDRDHHWLAEHGRSLSPGLLRYDCARIRRSMDYEFFLRLASKAYRFHHVSSLFADFRWHGQSKSTAHSREQVAENSAITMMYSPALQKVQGTLFGGQPSQFCALPLPASDSRRSCFGGIISESFGRGN